MRAVWLPFLPGVLLQSRGMLSGAVRLSVQLRLHLPKLNKQLDERSALDWKSAPGYESRALAPRFQRNHAPGTT
jgi:hypothetical protein